MPDNTQALAQAMAPVQNPNYAPRMAPTNFNTQLNPVDEASFRQWVGQNNVPFDPDASVSDYDMRGFWQAAQQQQPGMQTSLNPNDNPMHYPDQFKTPLHQSFSNESQWAGPNTPQWINGSQLAAPNGRIVFDERRRANALASFLGD